MDVVNNNPTCPKCHTRKLQKKGFTGSGEQKFFCPNCGAKYTKTTLAAAMGDTPSQEAAVAPAPEVMKPMATMETVVIPKGSGASKVLVQYAGVETTAPVSIKELEGIVAHCKGTCEYVKTVLSETGEKVDVYLIKAGVAGTKG